MLVKASAAPNTVARSDIKEMQYSRVLSALEAAGMSAPVADAVVPTDEVYVVGLGGTIWTPGDSQPNNWAVEVVNPVSGSTIIGFGSNSAADGSWPSFFASLPDGTASSS